MFLNRLKLFRKLRITGFPIVKANNADAHTVLRLARAKIMQEPPPLLVFFEILGDMPGEQNVAGIAAIHHSLRKVNARAGNVRLFI